MDVDGPGNGAVDGPGNDSGDDSGAGAGESDWLRSKHVEKELKQNGCSPSQENAS